MAGLRHWTEYNAVPQQLIRCCFNNTAAAAAAPAASVYIIFQEVTLLSSRGGLAISDPGLQCLALSRLHMLLWRPAWWPSQWAGDTARQMADRGVLLQLAALVKPGTDAGEEQWGAAVCEVEVHSSWLHCEKLCPPGRLQANCLAGNTAQPQPAGGCCCSSLQW